MQPAAMAFEELLRRDSLVNQIQRLPPELYSEIHDLTFTMNIKKRRIDSFHKPPGLLQVNQKWRNALSPTFYDKTIFITIDSEAHLDYLTRWLTSLTTEQRNHVACNGIRLHSHRKLQSRDPGISASGVLRQDRLVLQNRRALLNLRESVFWAILPFKKIKQFYESVTYVPETLRNFLMK